MLAEAHIPQDISNRLGELDTFLSPEVVKEQVAIYESREGGTEIVPAYAFSSFEDELAEDEQESIEYGFGWIARLSAPGFLDCTDWVGPFETAEKAARELLELYETV